MDQTRQIALGPALAGLAALVLFVSLFLDWYDPGFSAWTVFEVLDLLLAALALASLAVAAQAVGVRLPGPRVPGRALLPVALVALVIVVSQVINHPPGAVDHGAEVGLWLALGAAVALVAGAVLGSSYVSVVRVDGPGDSTGGAARRPGVGSPAGGEGAPTQPLSSRSEPERPV